MDGHRVTGDRLTVHVKSCRSGHLSVSQPHQRATPTQGEAPEKMKMGTRYKSARCSILPGVTASLSLSVFLQVVLKEKSDYVTDVVQRAKAESD